MWSQPVTQARFIPFNDSGAERGGTRQSSPVADTDSDAVLPVPESELDTAADRPGDCPLEDQLLERELKARMFGTDVAVKVGRYDVQRRIGRGGMGTVYMARDPTLDRPVALKVLRADRADGQERMLREAHALARLSHPNVVTVHEVGTHADRVFMAMELVQGQTLRQWLDREPTRPQIYEVFAQAARGLEAAHRAGLVHRDFKPDNVLIGDDGRVRVVDFGVVKPIEDDEPSTASPEPWTSLDPVELTATGQLLGTPAYMTPEQFLGRAVDARTDVFALCVTLYEALSGERPYGGEDAADVCRAVLEDEPRPLRVDGVPRSLADLVDQGLRRDPEQRPSSIAGLLAELDAAAGPASPRGWGRSVVIAGGLLGVGALALGVLWSPPPELPGPIIVQAPAAEVSPVKDQERPDTPVVACWIDGNWGSYFSFKDGPPMKNKKFDIRRPIAVGVSPPETVPPEVLADHLPTRLHLMNKVIEARAHLGLPTLPAVELPTQRDDGDEKTEG